MKKLTSLLCFVILLASTAAHAQYSKQLSSNEIYEKLEKFNFLGSALYIAAHPDDENTRLISYLSNGINARTAYLSLTRGDGGQNLIGTEIRELLGVIRSQELQMARSVDGGMQFFTRANDFGYSKHPDETLQIWNKDQVLEDIVYVIRKFKPDIIVNRFDHRTPGRTHGHHTSSAILALEAYDLAQDNQAYSWQLNEMDTWKVKRHFFNTSWWFYGSRENFRKADKSNLVPVDVGVYYPTLGLSNNEISAFARSKHRSQGFGSSGDRGNYQEYLELLRGEMPKDKSNIFDGIDTSWTRVKGGKPIKDAMDKLMAEFDFKNPSSSVPELIDIYIQISELDDDHWKKIKLDELANIITACMGLHIEASTDKQLYTVNDSIEIEMEWTNRSSVPAKAISVKMLDQETLIERELEPFTTEKAYHKVGLSDDIRFSNPYWLDEDGSLGMYKVEEAALRTLPESPPALNCHFTIVLDNKIELVLKRAVNHRYVDPAFGEIRDPLAFVPPATIGFEKELYLLASENVQNIRIRVKAHKDNLKARIQLKTTEEWQIKPNYLDIEIQSQGEEMSYDFELIAPDKISQSEVLAEIIVDGRSFNKDMTQIEYDHIPLQTILSPAKAKLVKVPMKTGGKNIAYLMGAGDKVPESLTNVGYSVSTLEINDIRSTDLSKYDAIVIGIRAYNTLDDLRLYNSLLFDYAKQGGTLITQYNTSRRLNFDYLAPYPIKLSRKRVTDEYAEIRILKDKHPVLNYPNKINSSDFDNWVQERGLYFPEEWDTQYEAILSCNDNGEAPLDGSLLVAPHGEGYFVYTSLSWFRQLPAGVPGAFRLFANILALSDSKENQP